MNLANCSVQIYLIDRLLDGEFTTYGLQVLAFAMLDDEERHDPMVRIFPKVAKSCLSLLLSLSLALSLSVCFPSGRYVSPMPMSIRLHISGIIFVIVIAYFFR